MQAFDDSPNHRWCFVFAHPDDELAILAWMAHLVTVGASVRALWLHSTPIREAESRSAMNLIGLPGDHMKFLTFPDGDFIDHFDPIIAAVREFVSEHKPDRVVTMAFEQGHLDHDTVHFACRSVFNGSVLEYPMYWAYYRGFMHLNEFCDGIGESRALDATEQNLKRQAVQLYPSQTIRRNILWYGIYRRLIGKSIAFEGRELLRIATVTDFSKTVHTGKIAERILRSKNWARWSDAIARHESNSG